MDFEVYKSAVCQQVKTLGAQEFIKRTLITDEITGLMEDRQYCEALYLLAMVDYLSNKLQIPLYSKYESFRSAKLDHRIYPRDIELLSRLFHDDSLKQHAWDQAIPEFKRHNIVESEVEDVC